MDAVGKSHRPSRRAILGVGAALTVNVGGFAAWRVLRDDEEPGDDGMELATVPGGDLELEDVGGGVSSLDVPVTAPAAERGGKSRGLITPKMKSQRFRMFGVTWHGEADAPIEYRTRTPGGGWGPWLRAPQLHDGPDRDSAEGDPDLNATEPIWVDSAEGLQLRVRRKAPRELKVALIDPGSLSTDAEDDREASARGATDGARARIIPSGKDNRWAPRPKLRTRSSWGANESWRNSRPRYNKTISQVHVHHTVSSNSYSRGDVPAMIRSMYRYHTHNLGWSDLGYNFLVDKFGRIWVGRAGGPAKNVRGAHTRGFNHASMGVAAIGNFERQEPSRALKWSIIFLSTWKLDREGVDPSGTVRIRSTGSDRYGYGKVVRLPRMDGHRDTNYTACPGRLLYRRLPGMRRWARRRARRFG